MCPASVAATLASSTAPLSKPSAKKNRTHAERFELVLADLQKRGNAKPGTVEKLLNTIKSHMTSLGEPESEADTLLGELRAQNFVDVEGQKVSYSLPDRGAT
jgi:hypothetical protein